MAYKLLQLDDDDMDEKLKSVHTINSFILRHILYDLLHRITSINHVKYTVSSRKD